MLSFVVAALSFGPCLHAQSPTPNPDNPLVFVLATDPTALEGTSSGSFTLIRYGPNTNDLSVTLAISGTASNGIDYAAIPAVVTIPTGAQAVDIPVQTIVDTATRGNKSVILTVVTNAAYRVTQPRLAKVEIIDDVFNIPPPTVAITSPTNNAGFDDPASITVTAEASDPGSPIQSVSFYANDNFLGKVAKSPYSLVWTNPHAGRYILFARAVDQVNQSTLSAPVQITVTDAVPVIKLTSPANGAAFLAHQDIPLQADASDSDDAIQKVSFWANDHLLGVVTNSPYTLVWSNAPAGLFLLRATAVDLSGDKGYSAPVRINISSMPNP